MEGHPEEDHHGEHQAQGNDALLGLLLRELGLGGNGGSLVGGGLLATLGVTERAAESIVDGDGEDERSAGYGKGEVISLAGSGVAQLVLGPLRNHDGCRGCEEGTDVDSHVEDGEASVALVGILRVVVEVTHHHLEVTLEETGAETHEHQSDEHGHEAHGLATQRNGEQQIAQEHDDDTDGHHLSESELVGHDTAKNRQEVDEHQEVAVDFASPSGIEAEVGS